MISFYKKVEPILCSFYSLIYTVLETTVLYQSSHGVISISQTQKEVRVPFKI